MKQSIAITAATAKERTEEATSPKAQASVIQQLRSFVWQKGTANPVDHAESVVQNGLHSIDRVLGEAMAAYLGLLGSEGTPTLFQANPVWSDMDVYAFTVPRSEVEGLHADVLLLANLALNKLYTGGDGQVPLSEIRDNQTEFGHPLRYQNTPDYLSHGVYVHADRDLVFLTKDPQALQELSGIVGGTSTFLSRAAEMFELWMGALAVELKHPTRWLDEPESARKKREDKGRELAATLDQIEYKLALDAEKPIQVKIEPKRKASALTARERLQLANKGYSALAIHAASGNEAKAIAVLKKGEPFDQNAYAAACHARDGDMVKILHSHGEPANYAGAISDALTFGDKDVIELMVTKNPYLSCLSSNDLVAAAGASDEVFYVALKLLKTTGKLSDLLTEAFLKGYLFNLADHPERLEATNALLESKDAQITLSSQGYFDPPMSTAWWLKLATLFDQKHYTLLPIVCDTFLKHSKQGGFIRSTSAPDFHSIEDYAAKPTSALREGGLDAAIDQKDRHAAFIFVDALSQVEAGHWQVANNSTMTGLARCQCVKGLRRIVRAAPERFEDGKLLALALLVAVDNDDRETCEALLQLKAPPFSKIEWGSAAHYNKLPNLTSVAVRDYLEKNSGVITAAEAAALIGNDEICELFVPA